MAASRKKRFYIVIVGLFAAFILYMGTYFFCVSVRFVHDPAVKESSIEFAGPEYKVSPRLELAARLFFLPAFFFDAYYLRPNLWEDRQKPVTTKPKRPGRQVSSLFGAGLH